MATMPQKFVRKYKVFSCLGAEHYMWDCPISLPFTSPCTVFRVSCSFYSRSSELFKINYSFAFMNVTHRNRGRLEQWSFRNVHMGWYPKKAKFSTFRAQPLLNFTIRIKKMYMFLNRFHKSISNGSAHRGSEGTSPSIGEHAANGVARVNNSRNITRIIKSIVEWRGTRNKKKNGVKYF